jgi:hypothetical protein
VQIAAGALDHLAARRRQVGLEVELAADHRRNRLGVKRAVRPGRAGGAAGPDLGVEHQVGALGEVQALGLGRAAAVALGPGDA